MCDLIEGRNSLTFKSNIMTSEKIVKAEVQELQNETCCVIEEQQSIDAGSHSSQRICQSNPSDEHA